MGNQVGLGKGIELTARRDAAGSGLSAGKMGVTETGRNVDGCRITIGGVTGVNRGYVNSVRATLGIDKTGGGIRDVEVPSTPLAVDCARKRNVNFLVVVIDSAGSASLFGGGGRDGRTVGVFDI